MSKILDAIGNMIQEYTFILRDRIPRTPQESLAELKTERHIINKGFLNYEDVLQWQEFKPYIILALCEDNTLYTSKQMVDFLQEGNVLFYEDVKRALLNYEIKMLERTTK